LATQRLMVVLPFSIMNGRHAPYLSLSALS